MSQNNEEQIILPLLALRDVVIYPHMVIPLFVGRKESIRALEAAMDVDKRIFMTAQKDSSIDLPKKADLYDVGCLATILQMLRLPDGTVKVLVEGLHRARLVKLSKKADIFRATVEIIEQPAKESLSQNEQKKVQVLMRSSLSQFEKLIKANKKLPQELLTSLANIKMPGRLVDSIAAHLTIQIEMRQKVLEAFDMIERLELIQELLAQELDIIGIEKKLRGRVKKRVEKNQRHYYLSEKRKAIDDELSKLDDNEGDEFQKLKKKIENIRHAY